MNTQNASKKWKYLQSKKNLIFNKKVALSKKPKTPRHSTKSTYKKH